MTTADNNATLFFLFGCLCSDVISGNFQNTWFFLTRRHFWKLSEHVVFPNKFTNLYLKKSARQHSETRRTHACNQGRNGHH